MKVENNFFETLSVHAETEEQQRLRFQVELEFIQCLANPNYLHCKSILIFLVNEKNQPNQINFGKYKWNFASNSSLLPYKMSLDESKRERVWNSIFIEKIFLLKNRIKLKSILFLLSISISTVIAQRGYFKDQTFINYLKYLTYWKEPEYARYIKYPMCLYFLDLLQYEHFRREIVNSQCVKFIDDQAILLWQHYTRRRMKLLAAAQQTQQNGSNQMLQNGHQQQNGNASPLQTIANGETSGNGGGGSSQRQA